MLCVLHHDKKELEFFCKNCDVAICNLCVATIHDGHAKIVLEEAASERKIQVKSVIETQKKNIEHKKNVIADLERQCKQIEARGNAVKRDIHKFAENMISLIETKKKEMLNKADKQIKESLGCVRTQQCEVKRLEIKNQQGHDCATEVRLKNEKDGSYKVRYFLKDTGKCQVSVKVNEEHIRGSPFPVKPKPRQFRHVLSFGQKGSSVGKRFGPCGVAVNERDEIAVTDTYNHRVQVFSSDGTYLRSFGRKGDKQGELNWPAGIAFDKNKRSIVVDSNNNRVQLFNEQGEYLSQFGGEGNLDHKLRDPLGLSVDRNENIIVADKGNKVIKTFSPSGQFLYKLGEGEGEGFTSPFHCIQYDKYLIVSDGGENCIKVFDINGNFLYKFGNKGNRDGKLNSPHFLSVNKAGHLMVCDKDNDRVQVFELSGKFVTKFGKQGSGPGEFNWPISTTVLSDGRIVVTDCFNSRIQIFK